MKLHFQNLSAKINYFNKSLTDFYEHNLSIDKILDNFDNRKQYFKTFVDNDNNIIEEDPINENEKGEDLLNKSPYTKQMKTFLSDTQLNDNANDRYLLGKNITNTNEEKKENQYFNSDLGEKDKDNDKVKSFKDNCFNFQFGKKIKAKNQEEVYSIVICITIQSEDYSVIEENIKAIFENLISLNNCGFPNDKILIILISDGISFIDNNLLEKFLDINNNNINEAQKFLDIKMDEIFKEEKYPKEKYARNYSITFNIKVNEVKEEKEIENENIIKEEVNINKDKYKNRNLDLIFCLKKNNCGRFDSHFWFISGFNNIYNPKYVIFLNGGNIPSSKNSLANLILPMINFPNIGGTCGETNIINEYKFVNFFTCFNVLDLKYNFSIEKNSENLFGLVSSLPLSFSAYSNKCLMNNIQNIKEFFYCKYNAEQNKNNNYVNENENHNKNEDTNNLLDHSHTKQEIKSISEGEILNRYLDYDRLLTFTLLTSEEKEFYFYFIPDSTANKIISEDFFDLLMKYRKEINGSNFANLYCLRNSIKFFKTSHKFSQAYYGFLLIFNLSSGILNYFSIGTFYFFYYYIFMNFTDTIIPIKNGYISRVSFWTTFFMNIYLFSLIIFVISSLIIKPKFTKKISSLNTESKINNILNNNIDNNIAIDIDIKKENPSPAKTSIKPIINNVNNYNYNYNYNNYAERLYLIFFIFLIFFNFLAYLLAIIMIFRNKVIDITDINLATKTENNKTMVIETKSNYQGAIFLFSISIIYNFLPIFFQPSMILIFLKNTLQYILLLPVYSIQFKLFAFCNTDYTQKNRKDNYHEYDNDLIKFKFLNLLIWLGLNYLQGWIFSLIITESNSGISLINSYSIILGIMLTFKLLFAFLGRLKYIIYDKKINQILEYKIKSNSYLEEENKNKKKELDVDFEMKENDKKDKNMEDKLNKNNDFNEDNNKYIKNKNEFNVNNKDYDSNNDNGFNNNNNYNIEKNIRQSNGFIYREEKEKVKENYNYKVVKDKNDNNNKDDFDRKVFFSIDQIAAEQLDGVKYNEQEKDTTKRNSNSNINFKKNVIDNNDINLDINLDNDNDDYFDNNRDKNKKNKSDDDFDENEFDRD
jgi:hypothetical protein